MRRESRSQERVTRREVRRIQKPCQQQRTIGIGGQRYRVEDNGRSNLALLVESNVLTLQTCSHATSTKAALSNLPKTIHHCLKEEVGSRRSETQAAPTKCEHKPQIVNDYLLDDIVAELIQQQRRYIGPQVLRNERNFIGSLNAFNDLLGGPSTVLVNTNHRQVGSNTLQHRLPGSWRAPLKELLDNLYEMSD